MSNGLAGRLGPLTVLDESGAATTLGSLWASRAVVLGFVRHFG